MYEVLPASAKNTFPRAVDSLKKRLQPVANEALLSSQLMKRKQRAGESVSTYTQELEALFEKSYGKRQGMDLASKELLKRDLFVQGLSLKSQEKVLPSAATFADALHQVRAAEEQDTLLGELHPGHPPDKSSDKPPPSRSSSQNRSVGGGDSERGSDLRTSDTRRGVRPRRCYICHSLQHQTYECPQRNDPSEASGWDCSRQKTATSSAVSAARTIEGESLSEQCERLQQEWAAAERQRMSKEYHSSAGIDEVTGALGPLYFAKVTIGVPLWMV